MCRLRYNKVQAARDLFYMYTLLEAEQAIVIQGKWKIMELVRVPRNRRAMLASEIVMFMQQFCGVGCPKNLQYAIPLTRHLGQHHRVLLIDHLPRRWLLRAERACGLARLRYHQLALCHSSHLHHRHLRPAQPPSHDVPAHVTLPLLHRLLVPHSRGHCAPGLHRPGHLPLRHRLLARRGPRALHLLG